LDSGSSLDNDARSGSTLDAITENKMESIMISTKNRNLGSKVTYIINKAY